MNDIVNFFGDWINQMDPIQKGLWISAFTLIGLVGGTMIAADMKQYSLARARKAQLTGGRRRIRNELTGKTFIV